MSDLEVFPISIPGGINQSAPVPEESDLEELLNFGIYRNRIGLRPPISVIATLQDDQTPTPADIDAVLDIVDHEGLMWAAGWSATTDDIYLYSMQVDGSNLTLQAVIWSGVISKPRIKLISTEGGPDATSESRIYAVDYDQNLDTMYWDGSAIQPLQVDFNADSSEEDVIFSLMAAFKSHMWGTGFLEGTVLRPELLRFSQTNLVPFTDDAGGSNPREWHSADSVPVGRRGDKIVALGRAGDRLLVFQKRSTHVVYGSGEGTWTRQELSNVVGCVGPNAHATVDERVCYFWASDGPYRTDGTSLQYIGLPVRQIAIESEAEENDTLVGYSPDDGLVYFVVSVAGADNYSFVATFDHRRERWLRSEWISDTTLQTEDAYSESNYSGVSLNFHGNAPAYGQTFTSSGSPEAIRQVKFFLKKQESPPDSLTLTAKIYAHSGTFGVDGVPTGSALTTSTPKLYSEIPSGPFALYTFDFPGDFTPAPNTNYVAVLETTETRVTPTDRITIGLDNTTLGHGGTFVTFNGTSWIVQTVLDIPFYVISADTLDPTAIEFGCLSFLDSASAPGPAGAPILLDTDAMSASTIEISWTNGDANVDTETHIYRSTSTGFSPNDATNRIATLQSGVSSYEDTDLSADTEYFYKIRHFRNSQHSSESAEGSATTWLAPPTALGLAGLTTGLRITGTNNASGADIVIQRRTAGGSFATIQTLSNPGGTFSYDDTGLTCGVTYFYRAKASDGVGTDSDWSTEVSRAACLASTTPTAPSTLTATADGRTEIDLAWTDNSDNEDGFEIHRSLDNVTFSLLTTAPANVIVYSDTGLSSNTTYYYKVRAVNTAGSSAFSNTDSALTDADLDAPTDLEATAVSTSRIDLTWSDTAADETAWEVHQSDVGSGGPFSKVATLGANVTSHSRTGLSANNEYWFKVRATRGTDVGSFSNTATDTTLGNPPAAPTNLTATTDGGSPNDTINLAWDDNAAGEDGYEVWRDSGGGFELITDPELPENTESYQDTGLTAGTTYTYKVRATHSLNGDSAFSNTDDATTGGAAVVPADPSDFTATGDDADLNGVEVAAVDLSWTDNSNNEDSFILERCLGAGCSTWITLATLPANTTSYRDTGVTADPSVNKLYRYRLRARNSIGDSNLVTAEATVEPQVTPSSLVATDVSFCAFPLAVPQIDLDWLQGDITGLVERRVQRSSNGGVSWSTIAILGATTNYSDTTAAFGTNYHYRIQDYHGTSGENTGTFTSASVGPVAAIYPDCSDEN